MAAPEVAHPAARGSHNREIYIDAFRGLMALVMVQGHVMDALLTRQVLTAPWYVFQQMFHGSTAPGFLFASGFVAGLPRLPLSWRATLRRTRRVLFVLATGYFLHLPYLSFWKIRAAATPAERATLFACDALQVIAVTQLAVIGLRWVAGRHWTRVAAAIAAVIVAVSPLVWSSHLSARLPLPIGAYLDDSTGSRFPVFPFSAFVLAGTLAGATLGRVDPEVRHRRVLVAGSLLLVVAALLAGALEGRIDYWSGPSPAYAVVRLGALLLLLRVVEIAARLRVPGIPSLALLGHETLLIYVLHLHLLFGGVFGGSPLLRLAGRLGFGSALLVVVAMVPVMLAAAWLWRGAKQAYPHEAQLALVFLAITVVYEFFTRPW